MTLMEFRSWRFLNFGERHKNIGPIRMLIQTGPKVSDGVCGWFSTGAIFNSWLWHAQAVHIFVSVGESWHSGAAPAAAATSRRVAVERPEPGSWQAVGFHESVDGVNVVQAGDLVPTFVWNNLSSW